MHPTHTPKTRLIKTHTWPQNHHQSVHPPTYLFTFRKYICKLLFLVLLVLLLFEWMTIDRCNNSVSIKSYLKSQTKSIIYTTSTRNPHLWRNYSWECLRLFLFGVFLAFVIRIRANVLRDRNIVDLTSIWAPSTWIMHKKCLPLFLLQKSTRERIFQWKFCRQRRIVF